MTTTKEDVDSPPKEVKDEKKETEAKDETEPKKKGNKKDSSKKVKKEVQDKIMACFAEGLDSDRLEMEKKEIAERLGTQAGSHGFFYSWQDLQKTKGYIEKSATKGKFSLSKIGKQNLPQGVVLGIAKVKTNDDKIEHYKKLLLKQCKEAVAEKTDIIFEILSDGKSHTLDEFTTATNYANLKSKGLGYPISFMTKEMKILEKIEKDTWQFTDKCFPQGRPSEKKEDGDSTPQQESDSPEKPACVKIAKDESMLDVEQSSASSEMSV